MKKLVLVDLDKTLLDERYRLGISIESLRRFIEKIQNRKLVVGISSDSSTKTISRYMESLNMYGPVIAEKGAVVARRSNLKNKTLTVRQTSFFTRLRKKLINSVLDNPRVLLISGDVNELSRLFTYLPCKECTSRIAVLVNDSREASLSLYAFKKEKNSWRIDGKTLKIICNKARQILYSTLKTLAGNITIDLNEKYGICIFHHIKTEKSLALPILQRWYPSYQIFVIGDSMTDYYIDKSIIHCAVGNADKQFKKCSQIVAKRSYTRGVVELLRKISAY